MLGSAGQCLRSLKAANVVTNHEQEVRVKFPQIPGLIRMFHKNDLAVSQKWGDPSIDPKML